MTGDESQLTRRASRRMGTRPCATAWAWQSLRERVRRDKPEKDPAEGSSDRRHCDRERPKPSDHRLPRGADGESQGPPECTPQEPERDNNDAWMLAPYSVSRFAAHP